MERIRAAIDEKIGRPLSMSTTDAAAAIISVAVNELAGAIRLISVEKGHDPRDFAMMPYGGAGPLHAVEIAREIGIPRVVVPPFPGITSALGCTLADVRHDYVQTINTPFPDLAPERVNAVIDSQIESGHALLERENISLEAIQTRYEVDILYSGQSHVIRIPIEKPFDAERVLEAFEEHYRQRFGLFLPEMIPVLVNVRTTVIGVREPVDLRLFGARAAKGAPSGGALSSGTRSSYFGGRWYDTPVYRREALVPQSTLSGPVIIEQDDSTIVVDPGATATLDEIGNVIVEIETGGGEQEK